MDAEQLSWGNTLNLDCLRMGASPVALSNTTTARHSNINQYFYYIIWERMKRRTITIRSTFARRGFCSHLDVANLLHTFAIGSPVFTNCIQFMCFQYNKRFYTNLVQGLVKLSCPPIPIPLLLYKGRRKGIQQKVVLRWVV